MSSEFIAKLNERWKEGKLLCVGLDSDFSELPESITHAHDIPEEALFVFNRAIIDATADLVCAFKLNSAFYEAEGDQGIHALKRTAAYLKEQYPKIPVILDAKRGDIGNTNEAYARAIFDDLQMDALTVHPYLGKESLKPFLDRKDKGVFVLVKTSNPGSGEFQNLKIAESGEPLHAVVAQHVAKEWNKNANCGVVVGATYLEELKIVREIALDMPILAPRVGAQGGAVEKTIAAGKGKRSFGLIVNSSRGIIFAGSGDDFADAARKAAKSLSEAIQKAL